MTPQSNSAPQESTRSSVLLGFVLVLSAILSLAWSHARLMEQDEFLSFYSDGVASFRQVVLVQLRHPISLDPPTYHLLSHLCMDLLGRNAMALRLPALAGFLLFQLCLYVFVRRLAGSRAGVVAAALPLLTASFRYSVEGRPYGLLLGLYALSLLCWQTATREDDSRSRRLGLIGLTLAIALAITSHYFGVLILIPVSLGEVARIMIRKRVDRGVVAALGLGLASVGLILPFQKALMVYRQHYYIAGVNVHDISQGYRELFLRYATWSMPLQKLAAAMMVVLALVLAVAGYKRYVRRDATEHAYTWAALVAMALLPFFGYLFGRFVTHTMEVRYVIAALIAFAATFAIVLERRLRSDLFYYATLAVLLLAAVDINTWNIVKERRASDEVLASLTLSPALSAALAANPSARLYEQSLSNFYIDSFYTPDAQLRSRFTLVYDEDLEVLFLKHDTNAITARNMQHFTQLPLVDYEQIRSEGGPHLVLEFRDGWNWIDRALLLEHARITPLGTAFNGDALSVEWPASTALNTEPGTLPARAHS